MTTAPSRVATPRVRLVGEQLLVGGGQAVAGVGNLVFALVAARVLPPADFTVLVAFLALYLVVNVPASSLVAGSALSPTFGQRVARRVRVFGVTTGVALGAVILLTGSGLGLPVQLLPAVAILPAVAGMLALARGQLYATRAHGRLVSSLLTEPAVRVTLGVGLALALGAGGAAMGVVAAGVFALVVARNTTTSPAPATAASPAVATSMLTFLVLAIVQNQDVLLANALLPVGQASNFAALSTLGGAALFATWNAPLVLLPRAADGDRGALHAALGITVTVGVVALVVSVVAAQQLVPVLLGARYAEIAALLPHYVAAMALLGVVRVLAAHRCATRRARSTGALVAAAAATQAALIALGTPTASGVAQATLVATGGLTVLLAAAEVLRAPGTHVVLDRWLERLGLALTSPAVRVVAVTTTIGLVARLLVTRGLWVDEAISVSQARLPFAEMLSTVAATDVHPPLHQILLWVSMRVGGDAELAIRLPFILVGAALVPLLYVVGRDLYSHRVGAIAALLGSVSPLAVWYAQEARMYSLYMVLALLAVWGQTRALRDGRSRDWALYALASGALLWTHYLGGLQVLVQQGVFLVAAVQRHRRGQQLRPLVLGWLAAAATVALILVPLADVSSAQFSAYLDRRSDISPTPQQAGAEAAGLGGELSVYRLAVNGVWGLAGYHSNAAMTRLVALWPLGMLASLAALGRGPWRTGTRVLLAVAIGPLLALFLLGGLKSNLFEVRYVIGIVPAALLLLARVVSLPRRATMAFGAAGLLTVVSVAGLADQQVNASNPRIYDFDTALTSVERRLEPGDLVVYEPGFLAPVIDYYAPDVPAVPLSEADTGEVDGRVVVVASFLDLEPHAGHVGTVLSHLRESRDLVDEQHVSNVRVWTFQ